MNKKSKVVSLATTALIATLLLNANQAKADTANKEADNTDTKSTTVAKDPQTVAKDANTKYYQAKNNLDEAKSYQKVAQDNKENIDQEVNKVQTTIEQQKEQIKKINQIKSETPAAKENDLNKTQEDVATSETNWNTAKTKLENLLKSSDDNFQDLSRAQSDLDKRNEAMRKLGTDSMNYGFAKDALIYVLHPQDYAKHGVQFGDGSFNTYSGLQFIHKYEKEFNLAGAEKNVKDSQNSKEQYNNQLQQTNQIIKNDKNYIAQLESDLKNKTIIDPNHQLPVKDQTWQLLDKERQIEISHLYMSSSTEPERAQKYLTFCQDEISTLHKLAKLYQASPQTIKATIQNIQNELEKDKVAVAATSDTQTKYDEVSKNWRAFQKSCRSAHDELIKTSDVLLNNNNLLYAFTDPKEAVETANTNIQQAESNLQDILPFQKTAADKLAKANKALAVAQANYDAAKSAKDKADQAS